MCDGLRVYKECGPSNPATCRDKAETHLFDNSTYCVEGCFCPPGYVEDGMEDLKYFKNVVYHYLVFLLVFIETYLLSL